MIYDLVYRKGKGKNMMLINSWKDLVEYHPLKEFPVKFKFHDCNIIMTKLTNHQKFIIEVDKVKKRLDKSIKNKYNSLCKELNYKYAIKSNIVIPKDLKEMYSYKYGIDFITINGIEFIFIDFNHIEITDTTSIEFDRCNIFVPNIATYYYGNWIYDSIFKNCYIHAFELQLESARMYTSYNETKVIFSKDVFSNCTITSDNKLNSLIFDKSILYDSKIERLKNNITLLISTSYGDVIDYNYKSIVYDCCIGKNSNYSLRLDDVFDSKITINDTDIYTTGLNRILSADCMEVFRYSNLTKLNIRLLGKHSMACPDTGEFIGYKIAINSTIIDELNKPYLIDRNEFYKLLKDYAAILVLRIPEDAKRTSAFSNKCRCSKAEVIKADKMINEKDKNKKFTKKYLSIYELIIIYNNRCEYIIDDYEISLKNFKTKYKVGKVVKSKFEESKLLTCAEGIHFFMNEISAREYFDEII